MALFAAGVLALWTAGCDNRPTYPKDHLAQTTTQLLHQEGLDASVRYIEHTLGVQASAAGVLTREGEHAGLGPNFDDVTRKILGVVHRVLLSSDAPVDFYVLLLSDPDAPGLYLTIVRYMDDVRRANANMIDVPEMFSRTVFELNASPTTLTISEYIPRDITLQEFLSWQIARRIQLALAEEFQGSGSIDVGRCGGRFQDREFLVTLNVLPLGESALDESTLQKIFTTSTGVAAKVLNSYQFSGFDSLRLVHGQTGVNRVLPRARLEIFR